MSLSCGSISIAAFALCDRMVIAGLVVVGLRLAFDCICGDIRNPCCEDGFCCGDVGLVGYALALWTNTVMKVAEDAFL